MTVQFLPHIVQNSSKRTYASESFPDPSSCVSSVRCGSSFERERDEKDVRTVVPIRSHLKPDPYTDQQWHVILDQGKEMNENEKRGWGFSVNNEGKTDPQITIPQKSLSLKTVPAHPGSSSCRYPVPTLLCQSEREHQKHVDAAGDPSMPP
jgi:hypothetical protein